MTRFKRAVKTPDELPGQIPDKVRDLSTFRTFWDNGNVYIEPAIDGVYMLQLSLVQRRDVAGYLFGKVDQVATDFDQANAALLHELGDIGVKLLAAQILSFNPSTDAQATDGNFHVIITPNATNPGQFDVEITYPSEFPGSGGSGSGGDLLRLKPTDPLAIQVSHDGGTTWVDLITVHNGADGAPGAPGAAGTPGDLLRLDPSNSLSIQISHDSGANWTTLITVHNGADGAPGAPGAAGTPGDLLRLDPSNSLSIQISHDSGANWTTLITVHNGADGAPGTNGTNGTNGISPDPFQFIFDLPAGSAATVTRGGIVDGTSSVTVHAPCGCGDNVPPPPPSGTTNCDAATGASSYVQSLFSDYLNTISAGNAGGATGAVILSNLLGIIPILGSFLDIFVNAYQATQAAGEATVAAAFDTAFKEQLTCYLYCIFQANGNNRFNETVKQAWATAIHGYTNATIANSFFYFLQGVDPDKIAQHAYIAHGLGADCSGCGCSPTACNPHSGNSGAYPVTTITDNGDGTFTATQDTFYPGSTQKYIQIAFDCYVKFTELHESDITGYSDTIGAKFETAVPSGFENEGGNFGESGAAHPQGLAYSVTGQRVNFMVWQVNGGFPGTLSVTFSADGS